jgi:K+-sensing histidine kinase KdpD
VKTVPGFGLPPYNPVMRRDRDASTQIIIALSALAPIALAMTLVGVRDAIDNANVALLLTVVVVAAGAIGGRVAGAVAAISAALSFIFFHTRPYLSLTIDSQDDVETTLLLLMVGLIVGQLAQRARTAKVEAAAGRTELGRIHRLAGLVARGSESAEVVRVAQEELADLLHLRECRFEATPFTTVVEVPTLERQGMISGSRYRATRRGDLELELSPDGLVLPVLARGQLVGRFLLEPSPGAGASLEARIVAVALADQVGASLALGPPSIATR